MPWISDEQKRLAKEVDLLSYLQASEPGELRKSGPNEYRTVTNSSLVISNGRWFWNRGQIGGRSALDYLMKVRGMSFVDAALTVLESPAARFGGLLEDERSGRSAHDASPLPVKEGTKPQAEKVPDRPQAQKTLYLPKQVSVPHKAVKYLGQRGIHSDVIGLCLKSGVLYEGIYKNPREPTLDGTAVCVFIAKDETGTARFAALRGIGVDLKRDATGSDKSFGFMLPAIHPNSRALAVFEAPIDLLSHATLVRLGHTEFDGHRLSLGGTAYMPLMAYLERNPAIDYISLCLDNDKAGQMAAESISSSLADEKFGHIAVTIDLPKESKDYNEALLKVIQHSKEHKPPGLHREAVSTL
ncbi:MAG: DUF3991 and toprim domain-containing protein [Defluviitaleaceae bacterium]|nr:DUF3991 and toprim domain-containing protein [Defluviitaleaceae bacterium]